MNRILLYAQNDRDVYKLQQWLAECVAKRIKSGKEVSVDHLANCSTMQKLHVLLQRFAKSTESRSLRKIEKRQQ